MTELFTQLWEFILSARELASTVAITLISTFLLWLFRARVNLKWGSTSSNFHQFRLHEDGQVISIWTEKFYIKNDGRKCARDIEIVFSDQPTSYNLWSPREHGRDRLDDGKFVLKIPSLAPKELLIVDTIDIDLRNPEIVAVNCPDALTTEIEFWVNQRFGNLFNAFVLYLMAAGFVGTVYLILRFIVF